MSIKVYFDSVKTFIYAHQYETGVLGLAIICLLSNFIMPIHTSGIFVILFLGIIIITVLIGSMFLLYNTTILALSAMFKEGLSEVETQWIKIRLRKNFAIICIWSVSVFLSFFTPKDQLGTIASIYLISILILFKVSSVDENPFLEKQKMN